MKPGDNEEIEKCSCSGEYELDRGCGVRVCAFCGNHKGLARCYCGWTESGNSNGYQELQEMGEVIEPEDY